jgi:glycosyltransferase involved in cell wall biosynthesis
MARLAVVIPVYNAEGCLYELLSRLTAVLKKITPSFEIIFVEDHSRDRSWEITEAFAANRVHSPWTVADPEFRPTPGHCRRARPL